VRAVLTLAFAMPGIYLGTGLGVAGGAYLRETGKAFVGEAEAFWFEVFLVLSLFLFFPRVTRWAGITLLISYVVVLAFGYWAGWTWGNFTGWHPD
jgi:Ca2+/Na+ antiporter